MKLPVISHPLLLWLLALLLSPTALEAESMTWIGGPSGNWNNPLHWKYQDINGHDHYQVPGPGDYASIPPATSESGAPLRTTVLIDSTVTTGLSYIGGDTTLAIAPSGTLTLQQPAPTFNDGTSFFLYGSIVNSGRLNIPNLHFYTFNAVTYGYSELGEIRNQSGGVIDLTGSVSMIPYWNWGVGYNYTIRNFGTIRERGDFSRLDAYLDNHGAVQAQNGTLQLNWGSNVGGTFQADEGAAIEFSGGGITLASTPTNFTGPGTVRITTAEVVLQNLHGPDALDLFGTTVSGRVAAGGAVNLQGGIVKSETALEVAAGGTLTLSLLWWGADGFSLYPGATLTVAAGGTLNVETSITVSGTLTNAGTVNWLSGSILTAGPATEFTNAAGGLFDIRCDGQLSPVYWWTGNSSTFHNAGTLRKSVGSSTDFRDYLDNTGTVEVRSGTLRFTSGSNLGGSFQADADTAIEFSGGTFTLAAAPTNFAGPGTVRFTTAEVVLQNLHGPDALDLFGTTVSGRVAAGGAVNLQGGIVKPQTALEVAAGGTLNLSDGGWGQWNFQLGSIGFTLNAGATLTVAAGGTLNLQDAIYFGGTLTNSGTVNWLSGSILTGGPATDFTNAAGGLFDIRCDGQLSPVYWWTGNSSTFHNAGTLRKSVGSSTDFRDYLDNTGTVEVRSGIFRLMGGASLADGRIKCLVSGAGQYGTIELGSAPPAGGLSVVLDGGYIPVVGDTFQLVSYDSPGTGFASVTVPSIGNWETMSGASSLSVRVVPPPSSGNGVRLENVVMTPGDPTHAPKVSGSVSGGPPGGSLVLQASSDLGIDDPWEDIAVIALDASGSATFGPVEDVGGVGAARCFFRLPSP